MPPKKAPAHTKSTRYKMQQRAKKLRPKVLAIRAKIPWVFGDNTFVYAAIAANGGALRETDITAAFGEGATRSLYQPDRDALGILRRFELQRQPNKTGPAGYAVIFDKKFPLAKEALALARKIGETHPLPIDNQMPKQTPPPPPPRKYDIDLIAGSKVNTLVLATVRVLRGKTGRVELAAAVPHDSLTAVERAIQRLSEYGILNAGGGGVYFSNAPWLPHLERLYDAYLRLRPGLREEVRQRLKIKRQRKDTRAEQNIFGYAMEERVLQALAVNGPMKRTGLATITMLTHKDTTLRPLVNAGILAIEEQLGSEGRGKAHGTRKRIVVSLNAAFPAYKELRTLLLALAEKPTTRVRDLSVPRDEYDPNLIFNTPTLLKALLLMNAVTDRELDVASLNRLRPEHAPFTLHGRMNWMLNEGIISVRVQGLVRYYALNPDYRAYKPLKRLLDRIGKVWPELIEAAAFNDDLKPAKRLTQDRNMRRQRGKKKRI